LSGFIPLLSQNREYRVIGKLDQPITFDGIPDEAVWEQLETFPMITHAPVFGDPPSEKSLIRMGYDDHFVYVGGLLYVSDPSFIQAIGKKRDMNTMSSDFMLLSFDTYNDKENSLLFATNPLGLRWDADVSNDGTVRMTELSSLEKCQ